jgi:hypothetical protein
MFSEGELFFPAQSGKKRVLQSVKNLVFLGGFSESSFASLLNRARMAQLVYRLGV